MTHLGELNTVAFFCDCGMARKGDEHTCVRPVSKRERDDNDRIVLLTAIVIVGVLILMFWGFSILFGGQ